MEVIFMRCSTQYRGRIDAELELSDVILQRYEDGTVVIHSAVNGSIKPKNWMPPGSDWDEGRDYMSAEHVKRGEKLEIFVDCIYHRHEFRGELHGKLVTLGSEREVGDLLVNQLWRIGDDLQLVQREYRTSVGPIDLLLQEASGRPVAVEVKRGYVSGASPLYQLRRYTDALTIDEEWSDAPEPRGVLAAKSISLATRALAAEMNIECVLIKYEDLTSHANDEKGRKLREDEEQHDA